MGVLDPPSDIVVSVETAQAGSGNRSGEPHYATNQFYGIEWSEPNMATRTKSDNPKFAWPQQQHMDQSGRTYTIQRGYMRSLLTDPAIAGPNSGVPNRRVFFQFNPLVLQREVQQSVGSMMPLLQDPAQLLQPVPGTTQFSFQLMFNREHEVNKGYDDPEQEWLKTPGKGEKALVSQIGVLADLMMLDSITGQGLSEDLLTSMVNRTKQQYTNMNTAITNAKLKDEEAGIDVEENAKDYRPVELPEQYDDDTELRALFDANIGNSAFLNPLPFRVMFSTLFMVEGVATSISVNFNKFSKTMVPTQCLVTINMYALYLGFAKQKTFIYNNLLEAAEENAEREETDERPQQILNAAVLKVKAMAYQKSSSSLHDNVIRFKIIGLKTDEVLKVEETSKRLTDIQYSFEIEYQFTHTADGKDVPPGKNRTTLVQKTEKNKTSHPFGTENVGELGFEGSVFGDQVGKDENGDVSLDGSTWNQYMSFRIIVKVSGKSKSGNVLFGKDVVLTTAKNWKWDDGSSQGNSVMTEYEQQLVPTDTTANNAPSNNKNKKIPTVIENIL